MHAPTGDAADLGTVDDETLPPSASKPVKVMASEYESKIAGNGGKRGRGGRKQNNAGTEDQERVPRRSRRKSVMPTSVHPDGGDADVPDENAKSSDADVDILSRPADDETKPVDDGDSQTRGTQSGRCKKHSKVAEPKAKKSSKANAGTGASDAPSRRTLRARDVNVGIDGAAEDQQAPTTGKKTRRLLPKKNDVQFEEKIAEALGEVETSKHAHSPPLVQPTPVARRTRQRKTAAK